VHLTEKEANSDAWEEEMERKRQNRLDSSSRRIIQQRCSCHCADIGFQESLAQRARFRHAHAHFFHQPCGTKPERQKARRAEPGKIAAFRTRPPGAGDKEAQKLALRTIECSGREPVGIPDWHVPVKDGVLKNMGPNWEAQLK
jgi:hypothetical protein